MMKRMLKQLLKRRRGMSLVETVTALVIFSFAVVIMGRITAVKLEEQVNIDSQYVMVKIDAFLSDIYHQYRASDGVSIGANSRGGTTLMLDMGADGTYIADFIPGDAGTTGKMYVNGVEMFSAAEFTATSAGNNLYVSVKVTGDRALDIDIYK